MNKNLHDIDKLFTRALKDYKEDPPKNIWGKIENDLNRKDAETYRAKYTSLRKTLQCIILVCTCLLVGVSLQIVMTGSSKTELTNRFYSTGDKRNTINNDATKQSNSISGKGSKPSFVDLTQSEDTRAAQSYTNSITLDDALIFPGKNKDIISVPRFTTGSLDFNNYPGSISRDSVKNDPAFNQLESKSTISSKQDQTTRKHHFYLIPFASIDHIAGRLQQVYEYDDQDIADYTNREKPDMSYTAGLLFEYGLSNKISLQSGVLISNAFTSISPTVVNAVPDNSGNYKFKLATRYGLAEIKKTGLSNPGSGDSILVNDAMVGLEYISVPVLMNVNLKQGKLKISGTAGVAINKIMSDKVEVDYSTPTATEIETIEKIEGIKKSFFTVIAGAEATYPVYRNINVGINPVIRYSLTPVNQGTPVKTYLISMGVGATVRIKL